ILSFAGRLASFTAILRRHPQVRLQFVFKILVSPFPKVEVHVALSRPRGLRIPAIASSSWSHRERSDASRFLPFVVLLQAAQPMAISSMTLAAPSLERLRSHSCRSAMIGSTFVARRAGMYAASAAANINRNVTLTNGPGSLGLISNKSDRTVRVSANDPRIPAAT